MSLEFATVAAITVIAYLVGIAAKNFEKLDDKWIPVIVGVTGAILGVIGYLTGMPEFPANDIITAIAVGIASGLAATGVNQIAKQLGERQEM